MEPIIAVVAAVGGYLIGSISFARIVARFADPAADISRTETVVGPGNQFSSGMISATAVRVNVGARYGIVTALLDMLKVFIPTLAFRLLYPDQPYDLIVATSALIGHDWPIYYRFVGGRGETAILGGLAALDPLGLVLMLTLGMIVGFLAGNVLALRWAGLILMVPWVWLTTGDALFVAYIVFALAVYFYAVLPEFRQYLAFRAQLVAPTNEDVARELGMGAGLGRAMDRYSIPGIIARLRHPSRGA